MPGSDDMMREICGVFADQAAPDLARLVRLAHDLGMAEDEASRTRDLSEMACIVQRLKETASGIGFDDLERGYGAMESFFETFRKRTPGVEALTALDRAIEVTRETTEARRTDLTAGEEPLRSATAVLEAVLPEVGSAPPETAKSASEEPASNHVTWPASAAPVFPRRHACLPAGLRNPAARGTAARRIPWWGAARGWCPRA